MSKVTDIRYVGYAVTDFERERDFYAKWGLKEVSNADGIAHFATEGHDELFVVRLRSSDIQRIDVIALAADTRADVDALHGKVKAANCEIISGPHDLEGFGGGYGFRFFSPDGLTIEISCDVARGTSRKMERWEGIPQKISHVVLHSPDHHAAVRFFCEVLGFKVSDWIADFMCFLRCNDAHHRLGFLPGPACLNHVAYDMTGVDAMMRGISNMQKQDFPIGWGPGRHTAGDNTFCYFVTPGGFAVEYTAELESVDDETWVPTVYPAGPIVVDQWGIASGGPHKMPHPAADAGLFQASLF